MPTPSDVKNDSAVQGTNDSSIVSKCSMVKFSYYHDDFLKHFVEKQSRRSPLIHRGYYVRAQAMDHCFINFLSAYQSQNIQVISFGAGFDSSYFRLKAQGLLKSGAYIEMDFADVMKRKKKLIEQRVELAALLSDIKTDAILPQIVLSSADYMMLGVDLSDITTLTSVVNALDINLSLPTLFISEVAITYMDAESSSNIIQWASATFKNAMFALYEQILPDDSFGCVMINHFNKLNSPLRVINKYPTMAAQCARFQNLGWPSSKACDMNQFYLKELSDEERHRMESLEPFDEHEEWHLKCAHYVLLCAFKGSCASLSCKVLPSVRCYQICDPLANSASDSKTLAFTLSASSCQMYGHTATKLTSHIICIGGFGMRDSKAHGRLQGITICDKDTLDCTVHKVYNHDNEAVSLERMYHTATALSDTKILLIGGRTSPAKPCDLFTLLDLSNLSLVRKQERGNCDNSLQDVKIMTNGICDLEEKIYTVPIAAAQCSPAPRWRHTVSLATYQGKTYCILFGGRSMITVYNDLWALDVELMSWNQLKSLEDGARHSHSSSWYDGKLFIACGLNKDGALGDIVAYDWESWHEVPVMGHLTPRYSHSSSIWGDSLMLLGGVSTDSPNPGLTVVNLLTGVLTNYDLPDQKPEMPIMLHNHDSVQLSGEKWLVLGGGGNCFSFGTHLNQSPFIVSL